MVISLIEVSRFLMSNSRRLPQLDIEPCDSDSPQCRLETCVIACVEVVEKELTVGRHLHRSCEASTYSLSLAFGGMSDYKATSGQHGAPPASV